MLIMSRAFVKEDWDPEPEPHYELPDPDSAHFGEAAASALIVAANQGNSRSAERATGYKWGEPILVPHVQEILERAKSEGDDRIVQLAERFLRRADGGR
jgi:hypothetical protein